MQTMNRESNFELPAIGKTRFETNLQVRPDDIDMNQHVHGSRYFDYVLAARYDQMARCYKMPMEEFTAAGLGWFVKVCHIEYKRPLRMGDSMIVRTWVDAIAKKRREGPLRDLAEDQRETVLRWVLRL